MSKKNINFPEDRNAPVQMGQAGTSKKRNGFFRRRKFKHGLYAIAITAVFIAIIIAFNIVATALAARFPLQLDLTSNKAFSVSTENKEYIKKVDRDVTITLCAKESDYTGGAYSSFLQNNVGVTDSSGGLFFTQALSLIKDYAKLNSHIKTAFVDPQDPSFTKYTNAYPSEKFSMGDILIESSFTLDGKVVKRHKLITLQELFTVDSSNYSTTGAVSITESKVETAVTSAIYSTTADKTYKVALITANGGNSVSQLVQAMTPHNYEFALVDSLLTKEIPKDADLAIIAAPTKDYTGDELKKLEDFLDLNGTRGKSILYIADPIQSKLPNLTEFLAEWGFTVNSGKVYETNADNYMTYNTLILAKDNATDYTKTIQNEKFSFISENNAPIQLKFTSKDYKKVTEVISFYDSTVLQPIDADKNWKASDAKVKGPFTTLAVSSDEKYNTEKMASYSSSVIMLSGLDFVNTAYVQYTDVGNLNAVLATVNKSLGREDSGISFLAKTPDTTSYADKVTQTSYNVMCIIFIGLVPLSILATGIYIWIRRKHL